MAQEILKIKTLSFTKLKNAEHLDFMLRVKDQAVLTGIEKIGVSEALLQEFQNALAIMNDVLLQNRASAETLTLSELDKKRDQQVSYILEKIRTSTKSINTTERTAGEALAPEIKPYSNIQNSPNQQESRQIQSLLFDLNKDKNKPYLSTLGLLPAMQALNDYNEQYIALTDQRTDTKQSEKLPDCATLRPQIEKIYDEIGSKAFAINTINPTPESTSFINNINALVDDANANYNRRMAQAGKKEEEKPKDEGE